MSSKSFGNYSLMRNLIQRAIGIEELDKSITLSRDGTYTRLIIIYCEIKRVRCKYSCVIKIFTMLKHNLELYYLQKHTHSPPFFPLSLGSYVASWSSGRHLTLGSGGPGFESWLCQVDVESLGKALYMHFLTLLMCKTSNRL